MILVLHNIRSAYNVGAIFRTADATAVKKIFLTGYTPQPTDRFGRAQSQIEKTSLGASNTVPWQAGEYQQVLEQLKNNNVTVVGIEQSPDSVSLQQFIPPTSVAYVLGNEVTGIEQSDLAFVDTIVELPMLGIKESLNVSVTAGVILYHDITTRSQ